MSTPKYVFPGLWSFVNRAAGNRDVLHLGRARDVWHFKEVQRSLGRVLVITDHESQRDCVRHALKVRESLAVILKGIDAAISEVTEKFDLYDKE